MSEPETDDRVAGARESQIPAAASTQRDALEKNEPFEIAALVSDLAAWRKQASRGAFFRFRTYDSNSTALPDALQAADGSRAALNRLLRPATGAPARDAATGRRTATRPEIEAALEDHATAIAKVTEALPTSRGGFFSKFRLGSEQRAAALKKHLTQVEKQLQQVRESLQTVPAATQTPPPDDLTELIESNNRLLDRLKREPQDGEPLKALERELEIQARKTEAASHGFAPVPTLPDGNWSPHGPLENIVGHLESYRQNREVWFARVGASWDAETSFKKVPSVANFETLRDGRDAAAQASEACQHAHAAVKTEFAAVSRDFPNDPEVRQFSAVLAAANKEFDAIRSHAPYRRNLDHVPSPDARPQRNANSQQPRSTTVAISIATPVGVSTDTPAVTAHRHRRR